MSNPAVTNATTIKMILFSVGEQGYCIPILSVREIREFSHVTPLPFSPHYVRGAINLCGTILTVVDLARYLNIKSNTSNNRRIIIIIESNNGLICGILVDMVINIENVNSNNIQFSSKSNNYLNGVLYIKDRIFRTINIESIFISIKGNSIS